MAFRSSIRPGTLSARVLLVAVSVLLSVVLAEGGLRLYFWSKGVGRGDIRELLQRSAMVPGGEIRGRGLHGLMRPSEHEEIVYELRPNLEGTHYGQPFRTNAHGFRGKEVEVKKPAGVLRIVGLGDSHMFGWGVAQGETFLEVLEQKLNGAKQGESQYEVLNFGTPGYNTVMEIATFEHKANRFEPDLIVVHFVGNDLAAPHFARPATGDEPSPWYLWEFFRALVETDEELAGAAKTDEPEARKQSYRHLAGAVKYRQAMATLGKLVEQRSTPVLVLTLGSGGLRDMVHEVADLHGYRYVDATPHFVAKMEALGVEVTRLHWRTLFRLRRDRHPTPLAHAAYADALFAEMESMGLVSSSR